MRELPLLSDTVVLLDGQKYRPEMRKCAAYQIALLLAYCNNFFRTIPPPNKRMHI